MDYSISLKKLMCVGFVLGLLSVATVGCGDDSDDTEAGSGGTSGTSGGSGGMGGSGGGGMGGSGGGGMGGSGGGGTGGGGTGGAPATVMCGTATCMGATIQGNMLPPCCDMDHGNICGLTTSMEGQCTGLGQMGTDNTTCPPIMNALEMPAPLCCTPEGECGYRSASLMGCIERSVYPVGFLSMSAETTAMFPLQTVACGGDEDAGM